MATYQIETDDGKVFEIETEDQAQPAEQPSKLKQATKMIAGAMYPPYGMQQMGDAIKKGADVAGEKTAETLAEKGVNPNIAAGIGTGIQMAPDIASSFAGIGAGRAVKAAAEGIEATGPITAAFKDPSILKPGTLKSATKALQASKEGVKASLSVEEAGRLRDMLTKNPVKLGNEVIKKLEKGADITPAEGVYYRSALNKMKQKGGEIASDAHRYLPKLDKILKKKSPELMSNVKKMADLGVADLIDEAAVPWMTTAVAANASPFLAAARLAATSGGQRVLGAAGRGAFQGAGYMAAPAQMTPDAIEALKRIYAARERNR